MKAVTPPNTTTSGQLTTVLSYGAILLLGYFVFLIVEPFLVPLAWSAVLAIFFYPLHDKMLQKMKATPAALTSTLAVTLLLIVPALVVLVFTAREALDATARLQSALAVHGQGPSEGLTMRSQEWFARAARIVANIGRVGSLAASRRKNCGLSGIKIYGVAEESGELLRGFVHYDFCVVLHVPGWRGNRACIAASFTV
jgi:predicted PurR-regulated permease PerM